MIIKLNSIASLLFFKCGILLLLVVCSFLFTSGSVHAASLISETYFKVADAYEQYYPFYLDDEQNPDWTEDGGSDDFSFIDYHKTYAEGSMHLEYEVHLENDEGDRLAKDEQVKAGDVIHVVVPTPVPSRDWGWEYPDATNWQSTYSYDDVLAATLPTSGPGPVVSNDNSNQVALVDEFEEIRRADITQSRFAYRGPSNGEAYYLAMFTEMPTITHNLKGTATYTQLSDTSYRVDSPGSVTVETTFAATDVKEYYAMTEAEIDRIITIYEELGYKTNSQRQLAYDRLQDLKSKVVNGVAIEEIEFMDGDRFTIDAVTRTNEFQVVAGDSTNPPAPDVAIANSEPIYPGDTVTLEISAPGAVEQVVYKMDWDNNSTNDEIVGSFSSGSTVLTTTREWATPGVKELQVRTYNEKGYLSDWTPVSVSIAEKSSVSLQLEMQVNDGDWSTSDQTIDPADSLALRWESEYADSCIGFNVNTSGATSTMPGGISVSPPPGGDSATYRVECTDGITVAVQEITVAAPVQPELYAYLQPATRSEAFNYTTGSYDEYTVNFVLANDAPTDEPGPIPYTVSLDLGANGTYEETQNGTFASGVGPDDQESRNITFTDIPFGDMRVLVDIDYPGLDALQTVVTVPPPEPESALEVTPIIVRTGTEALIEWDVGAAYPMNCTLRGGSLLTTFDPSLDGATGSTTTPALHSAMQYELRCIEPNTTTEFLEEFRVEVIGSPIEI